MKKTTKTWVVVLALMVLSVTAVTAYRGDYTEHGPDYTAERHDLMEQAFESNDYDAWNAMMLENGRTPRVVDVVTAENFETFVAAHEAAENGNFEEAARLRTELGLGNGQGMHDGAGHGMRDGAGKDGSGQGMGKGGQGNRGGFGGEGQFSTE